MFRTNLIKILQSSLMKKLFYHFIKLTIKLLSRCYFRRIKIYGKENIPKDGGIIFSPNHQGAFLDPLLVGCNIPGPVTSLTRSDVFGGPLQWFMDALKMLPVYRIRNGYANLKKNDAIFEKCKKLLADKQWIMMFSEASHLDEYYLKPLSKGSSRLAYEAQIESKSPIYILPVGINYGHHKNPFCDVHLVFGEAIMVNKFMNQKGEKPELINLIKDLLKMGMKSCMWLPDNDQNYVERKKMIHPKNTHLDFYDLKKGIQDQKLPPKKIRSKGLWHPVMINFFSIPNFPPLLLIKGILGLFKDVVFYSSIKMTAGILLLFLWWSVVLIMSWTFWGYKIAIINTMICIALVYGRQILLNKY